MKRLVKALLVVGLLCGCSNVAPQEETPTNGNPTFTFKHYASGGTETDMVATILFESANKTFTKYQVAFTSCTCRDAAMNFSSVMYVEILNTKDTPEEASIRCISFGEVDGYTPGTWGDSNPIHGNENLTFEYLDENFIQKLTKVSKQEFDNWGGYGTQVSNIEMDALTGATVSTANTTSVLKSLMEYHAAKYYTKDE